MGGLKAKTKEGVKNRQIFTPSFERTEKMIQNEQPISFSIGYIHFSMLVSSF